MDMRFSLALLLLVCLSGRTFARNARSGSYRHSRRSVQEYLAPPAADATYASYGPPQPPPLIPYRPGRFLSAPTTEAPGYFSRIASWLNPFGSSATPPPPSYGPPPTSFQGYPPAFPKPPPAGPHGYLPPKGKGKECNPCNKVPWTPLHSAHTEDPHDSSSVSVEVQPSISHESEIHEGLSGTYGAPSQAVRSPDFTYGPPPSASNQQPPFFNPTGKSPAGPIPYPHLYPGPMPPMFKAKPFNPGEESPQSTSFAILPSVEITSESVTTVLGEGYVDVLPPGAEVAPSGHGDISSPPPGDSEHDSFEEAHGPYRGPYSSEQHPQPTFSDHSHSGPSTDGKGVEVIKSVPVAQFSSSIQYPVEYNQATIIDVDAQGQSQGYAVPQITQHSDNEYTPGLNPPPNEPADSYAPAPSGNVPNDSYGFPVRESAPSGVYGTQGLPNEEGPPKDSHFASTVNNATSFVPTVAYNSLRNLPIKNDSVEETIYEFYPPSTESFITTTGAGTSTNTLGNSADAGQSNDNGGVHGQGQQSSQGDQKLVDSYQQTFNNQHKLYKHIPRSPETLVPYRPSSLYVPYPPYTSHIEKKPNFTQLSSTPPSGPTTEEPFLDALMKSYSSFKQEMAVKDQMAREHEDRSRAENKTHPMDSSTVWISQPHPSFSSSEHVEPTVYTSGKMMPPPSPSRVAGQKKNKQVQIIIPYTSQYTPSPFQLTDADWSGRGPLEISQARKVPVEGTSHDNYAPQESKVFQVTHSHGPLGNLLMKEVSKSSFSKVNSSIDVLRLQENIDNWTIQEYSRDTTSSTVLPSSPHPYLQPSKKIPRDYLTTIVPPSNPEPTIDSAVSGLPGFSFKDFEHEGSASSHVEVPHVQIHEVVRIEGSTKPIALNEITADDDRGIKEVTVQADSTTVASTTVASTTVASTTVASTTVASTTEASWESLPVSISPHNNERVYVVTPEPASRVFQSEDLGRSSKSNKFDTIERAYQVLPQAVNNLAVASTGSENTPLWGVMEHEEYAHRNATTSSPPVLYNGHSKVSNTRQ